MRVILFGIAKWIISYKLEVILSVNAKLKIYKGLKVNSIWLY